MDYFFQMSPYPNAYDKKVRTIYERTKKANSPKKMTLSELGKQNILVEKVYK